MRLYEVELIGRARVFATLDAARKFARSHKGERYKLERIETTAITKEVVVNMINGYGGYVAEREVIFNNLYGGD
jgi:hypothetical protein